MLVRAHTLAGVERHVAKTYFTFRQATHDELFEAAKKGREIFDAVKPETVDFVDEQEEEKASGR